MATATKEKNLYQRIAAVMHNCGIVIKNKEVKVGTEKYKAATHNAVNRAIREEMLKEGVLALITQNGEGKIFEGETRSGTKKIRFQAMYTITYVNVDDPNDKYAMDMEAHAEEYGDKAPGKASTYALKNAHMKTFFLEAVDDTDEDRLDTHQQHLKKQYPVSVIDMRETYIKAANALDMLPDAIEDEARQVIARNHRGEVPATVIALSEPLAVMVRQHLKSLYRAKQKAEPETEAPQALNADEVRDRRRKQVNAKINELGLDREAVKAGMSQRYGVYSTGELGGLSDRDYEDILDSLPELAEVGKVEQAEIEEHGVPGNE